MRINKLKNSKLQPKEKRQKSYPSIEEQLDMLWHDIDNGTLGKTGAFYSSLKDIKSRFPVTD